MINRHRRVSIFSLRKQCNHSFPLTWTGKGGRGGERRGQKASGIKIKLTRDGRHLDVNAAHRDVIVAGHYKINSFHQAAS